MPHGGDVYYHPTDTPLGVSVAQSEAAERFDVGVRSVQRGKHVIDDGVPELERLARDRGGVWHEIPAPDWAPPDLTGGRHWYASDDEQLVSIA